jgi:hypothetical protein
MSGNTEAITVMHRALDLLGRASADWRNGGHCEGTSLHWPVAVSLARRELEQALGTMEGQPDERTQDARAGMAWFNALTPTQRSHWLSCARSAVPADAWEAFKTWDAPR